MRSLGESGDVLQAAVHAREALPADFEERGKRGREDERVPQPARGQASEGPLGLRLLHEAADAKDGAGGRVADPLRRPDPTVFGLGTSRRRAQQHHQLRMVRHVRQDLSRVRAEGLLFENEMVRGKDGDYGLWIPLADPVRCEEHRGSGAPILRLQQDARARPSRKLARYMARVLHPAHDDGSLRRHEALHPVQRLAEERRGTKERDELLRALVAEEPSHQWSQSNAVTARQHDGPGLRSEMGSEFRDESVH